MGRHPLLESFDTTPDPARAAGPSEDWLAGHAAGLVEAKAAFAARQDVLSDDLAQSLADLVFSRAAARTHVLSGLRPLFQALVTQVLPALSRTGFAPHVLELLAEAAARDTSRPIQVALHPDQCAALAPLLQQMPADGVTLVSDPALGLHQARIATGAGETALDGDQLLNSATTALSAIFDADISRRYHD